MKKTIFSIKKTDLKIVSKLPFNPLGNKFVAYIIIHIKPAVFIRCAKITKDYLRQTLISSFIPYTQNIFLHLLTLLLVSSGKLGLINRWSKPILRPSLVILSILHCEGSTFLRRTKAAPTRIGLQPFHAVSRYFSTIFIWFYQFYYVNHDVAVRTPL